MHLRLPLLLIAVLLSILSFPPSNGSSSVDLNETAAIPIDSDPPPPPPLPIIVGPTPSGACLQAREACEHDTDCYHRLFYAQTTCVEGPCKSQCRTAVLRLYETKLGRLLLHSDATCLGLIRDSMSNCGLDPRQAHLHCSLAKLICQLDDQCATEFDRSETKCTDGGGDHRTDGTAADRLCHPECGRALARVFDTNSGRSLINCSCWTSTSDDDRECSRIKDAYLDRCRADALTYSEARRTPSTNAIENSTASRDDHYRNSNHIPIEKKSKSATRNDHERRWNKSGVYTSSQSLILCLGFLIWVARV